MKNLRRFNDYLLVDQKLFSLAGLIETNLITLINPQNSVEQKKKFFDALEKRERFNPSFIYSSRNPVYSYFSVNPLLETYRRELKELLKELGRDELGIIFESKIIDLLDKIELIKSIGTGNFSSNSESYFGSIGKEALLAAQESVQKQVAAEEKNIPLEKAVEHIKAFLKKQRLNYRITIREPSGARFAVTEATGEILISNDVVFSKRMLERLIAHEIETHIFRYENGLRQPYKILANGFSRETTETEEGLAVCVERLKGISSDEQIKEYAGRLLAIHTAEKHDFFETFEEMNKYFDKDLAFRLVLRAKRGISRQDKGGAFFKDALYFRGMLVVQKFLLDHKIKELYYGRYSVYDLPLVRDIAGLKEPKYLPGGLKN